MRVEGWGFGRLYDDAWFGPVFWATDVKVVRRMHH